MCFFTMATKYNEPLTGVNPDSDNDRYDIVGCGSACAGQPTLDLSDQLYTRLY